MKNLFYKLMLILSISFTSTILLISCDKDDDDSNSTPSSNSQYFSANVVGRDLLVQQASDNSTDITAQFNGYTFHLTKTATYSGTISASNDLLTVNGTWSVAGDFDKITFTFPTDVISSLSFFNKEWQFSSRATTVIELMASDGDILKFQRK